MFRARRSAKYNTQKEIKLRERRLIGIGSASYQQAPQLGPIRV